MKSQTTIGNYQVVRILGRGAGSTIYEARPSGESVRYALKHVEVRDKSDWRYVEQLEAEHACAAAVSHPAIRKCSDLVKRRRGLKIKDAYLVMEYVDGQSLREARPPTIAGAVGVFHDVARALAALAAAGYVHADIKPSNILIDGDGRVKLIDLGQSCPIGTTKKRIQGTADYIAPEQVKREPLCERTDMFNFGASLYWCVTGRTIPTLISRVDATGQRLARGQKYPRPRELNRAVPRELERLIGDCLRTHPSKRPETWHSVITHFDRLIGSEGGGGASAQVNSAAPVGWIKGSQSAAEA